MKPEDTIHYFKEFFEEYYLSKITENARLGKKRVTIEYTDLARFNPELAEDLINQPEDILTAAELALEQFDIEGIKNTKVRVRGDLGYGTKLRIRDLRAKHLNHLITIEGTIETKTDMGVKMTASKYECPSCSNIINVLQMADEIAEPKVCGCGRKGKFHLKSQELIDCFTLRLQELSSSIKYGSNMPVKSVLCKDDLADSIIEEKLVEGIKVRVNGVYKDKILIKRGKKQTQLVTYIEANYIQISEETFYDIELSKEDIKEIKEFSEEPNLIKKIAEGLFQGVHGYSKIKEALVLQAFGGVSDYEAIPPVRGDVHILLVGDAGQNKTVFLIITSNFSPKSILVVGKSVSAVGLSGAVIKDELSGSFVLKPGAMPLANNGIILIDELDKMRLEDRDILHEPMENQSISISKANLPDRKMMARESFLVSMNPKNAYFNDFDPIYQQIDLPPTLISRFDLVFIMRKAKFKDEKVKLEEKEKAKVMMTRGRKENQREIKDFHKFMRKYIAYAKQNIHPRFDRYLEEEYIPDKYSGLDHERKPDDMEKDSFPITPRHLWIIKRLAEARRRIFLEEKCTVKDVDYSIEKIRGSLDDIAIDIKTGRIDEDWVVDGVSSKRKKLIEIFDEIYDKLMMDDGNVVITDLYHELTTLGFETQEIDDFLYKKEQMKEIFHPRHHLLRKLE